MRVLITAGQVYGRLDDNKLVGNRVRGLWATRFAEWLAERGHQVTLVLPDTFASERVRELGMLRTWVGVHPRPHAPHQGRSLRSGEPVDEDSRHHRGSRDRGP